MVLGAKLEGPVRRDELEPLYLALPSSRLYRAVLVDDHPPALLLLRRALVICEGAWLEHAPVLPHGREQVAAFE